jgi:hypothetical protein
MPIKILHHAAAFVVLAAIVSGGEPGRATRDPSTVSDTRLGADLRHLWPLEKPVYVNRQGKIAIRIDGMGARDFAEGIAAVEVDHKWGFIDPRGQWVITPRFDGAESFSAGLAAVQVGSKWGYCDRTGTIVIPPQFTNATAFQNNLAVVNVGDSPFNVYGESEKWGIIDRNCKWVVKPIYDSANPYSEGFARLGLSITIRLPLSQGDTALPENENEVADPGRVLVDSTGRRLLNLSLVDYAGPRVADGLLAVQRAGRAGYVDPHGQWRIPPRFKWAYEFSEGLAAVQQNTCANQGSQPGAAVQRKHGYINRSGRIVIAPRFDEAGEFHDGLAAVRPVKTEGIYGKGDRWGYINKCGRFRIPLAYNEARDFSCGLAWVHRGGKLAEITFHQPPDWQGGEWLLIDTRGCAVWRQGN